MNEPRTPPIPGHADPSAWQLLHFERLLADLSARFVNLPAEETDAAITDALRRIVELLGVDRSVLLRLDAAADEAAITHWWARDVVRTPPKFVAAHYPWAISRLRAGQAVVISRVADLPPEARVDRASWQSIGVRSHLSLPMRVAGRIEGAITLACLHRDHAWSDDFVERARVLATIFGNALAHKRSREELDAARDFERVTSDLLAALLTTSRAEQDRVIEEGLRAMARVFGAERAALWRRNGDRSEFARTHRWVTEDAPAPPKSASAVTTPWIGAQIAAGAVVRFARHGDLPLAAAGDLPGLREHGVRAGVMVPLRASGAVAGALSFAMVTREREWPETLIPRVILLGDVLASALARQESERREQEAQVQAAHAARVGTMGAFAASLVHELTQPLAASLANAEIAAELLASGSPDLDELRATVADVVADDRRAGDLIQQLRRFLRRGEVHRTELHVRELVDDVLRIVANEAADRQIAVSIDIPEPSPKVAGDRVQIQQVLLNLFLNGFEAVAANAPGSRTVSARVRPAGTAVSIEVADTGRGMDAHTLANIFQPFFTTKPGGMGLGLSISRTIASAHGGTLSAQSAPGSGTTFRLELPSKLESTEASRPAPPPPSRRQTGTVYVIDDDPSMCRAIERQLQREGLKIETFASAQAYVDREPGEGVACIVSDVRMPGLSGLDLQGTLAQANRALPIVFISGHGDIATTVHAMKAGAVSFLAKPFTRKELLAAVGEALARSSELAVAREHEAALKSRYESLTPREREVFALVAAGLLNKVIADRLGAAEATVKIHRGRVMEKMGAASAADLVRMAERLAVDALESRGR